MFGLVKTAGVALLKNLLIAALSEQALRIVVIGGLRKIADSSKNTVDNEWVDTIEVLLNKKVP